MDKDKIDAILKQIAFSQHTTVEDVRKEILLAMEEAQQSQDPLVQARWAMIPCAGAKPTIEELITYIANMSKS